MPRTRSRSARTLARFALAGALVPLLALPADATDCFCDVFADGATFRNEDGGQAVTVTATGYQGLGVTSDQYAITGYTTGASMIGVRGWATNGYGVYGQTDSTTAATAAVSGLASATTGAVRGVAGSTLSTSGIGVYGGNTSTSGFTFGVSGSVVSPDGTGVAGLNSATTGGGAGVRGTTSSTSGYGVYAEGVASTGTHYGVYSKVTSNQAYAIYGRNNGTTGTSPAIYGTSPSTGAKVTQGYASATTGSTYAVYGSAKSTSGTGIYGTATATSGTTYGAQGVSSSTSGRGVYGNASASSGTTYGVYGKATSATGYGVYSEGNFAVTGSKSAVVDSSYGPTEVYSEEATEVWFTEYGGGQLDEGRTWIDLDPDFLELVTIDQDNPLRVFVQLEGDARGVYVEPGLDGFEVVELAGGRSNARFSFRAMAHRAGYEDRRLRRVDVELGNGSGHP